MDDHQTEINTDPLRTAPLLSDTDPLRSASPLSDTEALQTTPPLPESDTDSETSEEVSEQVIQRPHLTPSHLTPSHHVVVWQTTKQYGFQALLWIQFFWTLASYVTQRGVVVGKSVLRSIQGKIYVFFQDSKYPYRIQDTTLAGPGIAPVEWYYDADKKFFISSHTYNTTTDYEGHHLEWLSAEIKYNDLTLYDVTDYIQEVKWTGTTKPSPSHVLAAWSLDSGIVLHTKDGVNLHTLNEDGTESTIPIRG